MHRLFESFLFNLIYYIFIIQVSNIFWFHVVLNSLSPSLIGSSNFLIIFLSVISHLFFYFFVIEDTSAVYIVLSDPCCVYFNFGSFSKCLRLYDLFIDIVKRYPQ